ncbi:MAG: AraC family transcriptional regulator, partial [Chryseobacterium sp.]
KNDLSKLDSKLQLTGFEILEDSSKKQIEKIKNLLVEKIAEEDIAEDFMLTEYISSQMNKDYSSLSKLFSQNESVTLEQYFILQKIEKVKELLLYKEFNLTEISQKLGYKSVQHLSSQFKKITGFSPTQFLNSKEKRIALDQV